MIIASYKGGNQDREKFSNLSGFTELVSGRAGIQTLATEPCPKLED